MIRALFKLRIGVGSRSYFRSSFLLRQLSRRVGPLSSSQQKAIRKLPLSEIESLGGALLDFIGPDDLNRWLRLKRHSRSR